MASFHIHAAHADDATAVSKVILAALRETNAKDYSADVYHGEERTIIMEKLLTAVPLG
jgi:hypothetical protein